MRQPLQSFDKSDSYYTHKFDTTRHHNVEKFVIGEEDMKLCKNLIKAGSEERKFLRQIFVSVDITMPSYFASELDTYKIATVRNSSSLQHKGASRDFVLDDFELDDNFVLKEYFESHLLPAINEFREMYEDTKDYKYFRCMRQLIPMSYKYTITYTCNYENLLNMYMSRKNHRLKEWHDFCDWCETLPYFKEFFL